MNNLILKSCLWSCLLLTTASATFLKGQKKKTVQRSLKEGRGRSCKAKSGKNNERVSFECGSKGRSDSVGYSIVADEDIEIDIKYKSYSDTLDGNMKTETKFEVSYTQMIEYTPKADNLEGGYNFDQSTVVQEIDLTNWAQSPESMMDNADGTMTYNVRTQDGTATFQFTVDTNVKPETGDSANTMKIDVNITDFPWKANNTFLALVSTVKSEKKVQNKVPKMGKKPKRGKDVVTDDTNQIAQGYAQGGNLQGQSSAVLDIPFGTTTADDATPFGEYNFVDVAAATVPVTEDTRRNRKLQGEMTKESVAISGNTTGMSKEDYVIAPEVEKKDIFVEANVFEGTEDELKEKIAFSFIYSSEATEIYWDPTVGIGYTSASSSTFSSSGTGDNWISTSVGFVRQQRWFVLSVVVGVAGNLLL